MGPAKCLFNPRAMKHIVMLLVVMNMAVSIWLIGISLSAYRRDALAKNFDDDMAIMVRGDIAAEDRKGISDKMRSRYLGFVDDAATAGNLGLISLSIGIVALLVVMKRMK